MYQLLIDLKKAYDSVRREVLYNILTEFRIPMKPLSELLVQQFNRSSFFSVLLSLFTVVGMDRCEEDWYASDNNLRGTPRGSRKKQNAGR